MKYLFGPVNSRRLGISLGIDLVPFKTCTFNCVYCECGATTDLTIERRNFVPPEEVIKELDDFLAPGPELDVITFAGSGEPTLYRDIGRIIRHIRKAHPSYKIAVLTNGTLLWDEDVRNSLLAASTVIPTLDAVSEDIFNRILRPAPGLSPSKIISGIKLFSREFTGDLIVEVFLVPGLNDTVEELTKIRDACLEIAPLEVHVNSLDRPGTEEWVQAAGSSLVDLVLDIFKPLDVKIIGKPREKKFQNKNFDDAARSVIAVLKRRPSTLDDLHRSLGIRQVELLKIISQMKDRGIISVEEGDRGDFYRII